MSEFDKYRIPAVLLIISGSLSGAVGLLTLMGGLFRLLVNLETMPGGEAERIGYLAASIIGYGMAFLSLAAAPFIIYGGSQLLSGNTGRSAKAAAFLSLLPTNCCFIIGFPFAMWAIGIIYETRVQSLLKGQGIDVGNPPH